MDVCPWGSAVAGVRAAWSPGLERRRWGYGAFKVENERLFLVVYNSKRRAAGTDVGDV